MHSLQSSELFIEEDKIASITQTDLAKFMLGMLSNNFDCHMICIKLLSNSCHGCFSLVFCFDKIVKLLDICLW